MLQAEDGLDVIQKLLGQLVRGQLIHLVNADGHLVLERDLLQESGQEVDHLRQAQLILRQRNGTVHPAFEPDRQL